MGTLRAARDDVLLIVRLTHVEIAAYGFSIIYRGCQKILIERSPLCQVGMPGMRPSVRNCKRKLDSQRRTPEPPYSLAAGYFVLLVGVNMDQVYTRLHLTPPLVARVLSHSYSSSLFHVIPSCGALPLPPLNRHLPHTTIHNLKISLICLAPASLPRPSSPKSILPFQARPRLVTGSALRFGPTFRL